MLRSRLANGSQVWASFGNFDVKNPRATQHFLTLSIEHEGKRFHLARYHDFSSVVEGPEALVRFLGLHVDDVFPIVTRIMGHKNPDKFFNDPTAINPQTGQLLHPLPAPPSPPPDPKLLAV